MININELRRLAQAVIGWGCCNQAWLDQSEDTPAAVVGHIDEDGNTYPVATIDCDQYYAAHQSLPLAKLYAAANPAAILELLDRLEAAEKERDAAELMSLALRAKIAEMERQEPVAEIVSFGGPDLKEVAWKKGKMPALGAKLYALPGAQNVPEKLCYDSRWEISIDYVDGWNAAVDMMRGKSPSWHCPDCCIAFPFGAPKSCPHDDARCNSLLAAAPEAKP